MSIMMQEAKLSKTTIESIAPTELSNANFSPRGMVNRSPVSWRDEFMYYIMPDRFSDSRELDRPLFNYHNQQEFKNQNKQSWMKSGKEFQGGNLFGIKTKLNYLKNLGITTIMLGPIFKQNLNEQSYHGYSIQNFMDVDPRFGTRQELRDLIDEAHERGMYVILDMTFNTTKNLFVSQENSSEISASNINEGIWPRELQQAECFTTNLNELNMYNQKVVQNLIKVCEYWVALSDCDGFRIDSIKNIPASASNNICCSIREYAETIGKENFMVMGETQEGSCLNRVFEEVFERNLSGIYATGEPSTKLANFAKGLTSPVEFFSMFMSNKEAGRFVVTSLDDASMSSRERKARFSSQNDIYAKYSQVAHAVGTQLTTNGIPSMYYGTEQALEGCQCEHDYNFEDNNNMDRYIRESMFGSEFGAFETSGCHFFNEQHPVYQRISAIARIRNQKDKTGQALRRGRQFMRELAYTKDSQFQCPENGQVVAWSRILDNQEVVVVLNTNGAKNSGAYINVDASLNQENSQMKFLYNSNWRDDELNNPPQDHYTQVCEISGRTAVRVDLPPAGMAIITKI